MCCILQLTGFVWVGLTFINTITCNQCDVTFFFDVIRHSRYFCDLIWHSRQSCGVIRHYRHSCNVIYHVRMRSRGSQNCFWIGNSLILLSIFISWGSFPEQICCWICGEYQVWADFFTCDFELPLMLRSKDWKYLVHLFGTPFINPCKSETTFLTFSVHWALEVSAMCNQSWSSDNEIYLMAYCVVSNFPSLSAIGPFILFWL